MADGRARLVGRLGDKLIIGTTTDHYLCGRLLAVEADSAIFAVGAERVRIPLLHVDNVVDAHALQAEFVK